MAHQRIVVIGASAGGVRAYQDLAASMPADFPAPIVIVQHIGSHASILPDLMTRRGPLAAMHAQDGDELVAGRILVAPPDHHVLVAEGRVRLSHGAKENHARPAIDPLFRSAAVAYGPGAVGVLLTGYLDDGTAGLQAIKARGGIAVVQDPKDAESHSMPQSALRYVEVDHVVALASMAGLLARLVARPAPEDAREVEPDMVRELEMLQGLGDPMENAFSIGRPSAFACPECHGTLWELEAPPPRRYRCHTGHAFTMRALQHAQSEAANEALWNALRALQEKEAVLKSMAQGEPDAEEASRLAVEADEVGTHAATLRGLIEQLPTAAE